MPSSLSSVCSQRSLKKFVDRLNQGIEFCPFDYIAKKYPGVCGGMPALQQQLDVTSRL